MQIGTHKQPITLDKTEATRCWLTPLEALDICRLHRDGKARTLLANLSSKGIIPCEKADEAKKTSPRLYSFTSCLMFRAYFEFSRTNKDFEAAELVAQKMKEYLDTCLERFPEVWDMLGEDQDAIIYGHDSFHVKQAHLALDNSLTLGKMREYGWFRVEIIFPQYLTARAIQQYALRFADRNGFYE